MFHESLEQEQLRLNILPPPLPSFQGTGNSRVNEQMGREGPITYFRGSQTHAPLEQFEHLVHEK